MGLTFPVHARPGGGELGEARATKWREGNSAESRRQTDWERGERKGERGESKERRGEREGKRQPRQGALRSTRAPRRLLRAPGGAGPFGNRIANVIRHFNLQGSGRVDSLTHPRTPSSFSLSVDLKKSQRRRRATGRASDRASERAGRRAAIGLAAIARTRERAARARRGDPSRLARRGAGAELIPAPSPCSSRPSPALPVFGGGGGVLF